MKKFAFYLPQFHEIKENNEWWGKGFTEWTNVKKAESLFKGHIQPKHPLNDNYYNLLNKDTVVWQTELMKKYKVDGMIYYHYYFEGKHLLEKPAENLLHWKDIEQPFFFCWANHTWNRSWEGTTEVLLEQTYGGKESWERHFEYLLPFFKDSRYEKCDNKPVFMLFISDFKERKDMFEFFDKKCKENGFDGIYLIETFGGKGQWPDNLQMFTADKCAQTEKIFIREYSLSIERYVGMKRYYPRRIVDKLHKTCNHLIGKQFVTHYRGDDLYNIIINNEPYGEQYVHGLSLEWDNTPRHKTRGYIVSSPSKKMFFKALDKCSDGEYVFINAWNEWAEGMILEPTKDNGYKYLEWIKEWSEKNV